MSTISSEKPKKRDRTSDIFRKRWRTFVESGFEVHRKYQADVYILMRRNRRMYELKSISNAWPLSPEDIVRTRFLLYVDDM